MQLTVNGRSSQVADGTDLPGLLRSLGLQVGSVVVEHNGTALLRSEVTAAVELRRKEKEPEENANTSPAAD